jgi:hypothetical protein
MVNRQPPVVVASTRASAQVSGAARFALLALGRGFGAVPLL